MDVNPIPAFGTQNDVSRTLTKYAVVLKLPTLITSAITGSNPVTPGFIQVLTHDNLSNLFVSSEVYRQKIKFRHKAPGQIPRGHISITYCASLITNSQIGQIRSFPINEWQISLPWDKRTSLHDLHAILSISQSRTLKCPRSEANFGYKTVSQFVEYFFLITIPFQD